MKSLAQFIKEHRQEIDDYIQKQAPGSPKNDRERRLWILNNEHLYNWARSERVNI